jgi:hypothetical protein
VLRAPGEYSLEEYEAVWEELRFAGLDDDDEGDLEAIEAHFKKLNEADETAKSTAS